MEQIAVERGSSSLEINGRSISFGKEVSAAAYCREPKVYLALLAASDPSAAEEVVGLSQEGAILFRVSLPDGWQFYYFASHIDYPLAMVCISSSERFDWYWGIEPKQGRLISLNRAY